VSDHDAVRLDDMHFEGPNLDLPPAPEGLAYADYEDWRADALLAANGVDTTERSLLEALRTRGNVLLAAAARASGRHRVEAAKGLLREVAEGPDDYAGVEAAYGLARLGEEDGRALLRHALERPLGPYLSPVLAAGHLARLGDPSGFPLVREGLGSDLLAVKMLGCKQLAVFLPFEGEALPDGSVVDARAQLERASGDPELAAEARAQLPPGS
jgi:hypothetical protein